MGAARAIWRAAKRADRYNASRSDPPIVRWVERVRHHAREDLVAMVLSRYMGASVKRREDPRLITGSSVYVDDLKLAGMVHVSIVRSPHAHAKITRIDTAAAE